MDEPIYTYLPNILDPNQQGGNIFWPGLNLNCFLNITTLDPLDDVAHNLRHYLFFDGYYVLIPPMIGS